MREFVILVTATIGFSSLSSSRAEEPEKNYPKSYYSYTDISGGIDSFLIINDPTYKSVAFSDLELSATFSEEQSQSSPVVLEFDWPYNIAFYLPGGLNRSVEAWTYKNCEYKVITWLWGFQPRANREVTDFNIEQSCKGDEYNVRYEYSDYFGLQSFAIGKTIQTNDIEDGFELKAAYALFGAEIGFGAKQITTE